MTLIFSLERYRAVINAFQSGLELAKENGHDLSKIHSVASFFVSRVDTEIDKRLNAIGTDEAKALKGKAGVANARLATRSTKSCSPPSVGQSWPKQARSPSARCGPPPASRTRRTRTPCT
ncbi:transaldolase [Arthrobacter sp. Hiyo1]|nr:transaldolase [Arthrobacter sp. Hiyo1]